MHTSDTVQNVYAIGRVPDTRIAGQKAAYSDRKTFTGSVAAARNAWADTVTNASTSATAPEHAYTHHGRPA